jgi:Bacteriophage Sf6, terminase small subunit-like
MARPTKYSEQVVTDICQALQAGAPIRIACGYAGIDEATYHRWQERFSEFRERSTRARYGQAVRNLALIQKAAPEDFRAAETALRLSFPQDFARRLDVAGQVEHGGEVRHAVRVDVSPATIAAAVGMAMAAQGMAVEETAREVIDVPPPAPAAPSLAAPPPPPARDVIQPNGARRYQEDLSGDGG